MAATPSPDSKPTGDHRDPAKPVTVDVPFEEKLNQFWQNNRMMVLGLCAVVLLAIIGKDVWQWTQRRAEAKIQAQYAVATKPEQVRAFIAAHPKHPLAGVAEVKLADEAYAAGKSADAISGYDRAVSILKDDPLAARAQLGRALARIQAGKSPEAVTDLKALASDAGQLKAVRAEAAYHLASLAADAGNAADVQKYVDQLNQIDPASMWARRALSLQAALPRPAAAPAAVPAPAKKDDAPSVQLKLPGK